MHFHNIFIRDYTASNLTIKEQRLFLFPFSLVIKGLINGTLMFSPQRIHPKRDMSCSRGVFGIHTLSVPALALARA